VVLLWPSSALIWRVVGLQTIGILGKEHSEGLYALWIPGLDTRWALARRLQDVELA